MRLADLARVLAARPLTTNCDPDLEVVFGAAADLMSDVLAFARPGAVLLTGLTTPQVIRTAEVSGVSAIVLVRGKGAPQEVLRLAEESGIPLLQTSFTMFDACGRLYAAGLRHHFAQTGNYLSLVDLEARGDG